MSHINLAKDVERAKPIRHDGQPRMSAPFEGDPTYRSTLNLILLYRAFTFYFHS